MHRLDLYVDYRRKTEFITNVHTLASSLRNSQQASPLPPCNGTVLVHWEHSPCSCIPSINAAKFTVTHKLPFFCTFLRLMVIAIHPSEIQVWARAGTNSIRLPKSSNPVPEVIKGNTSPNGPAPRVSKNIKSKEISPSLPQVVSLYHPPSCEVLKQPLPFWWYLVCFVQNFRGVSCLCPRSEEEKLGRNNRMYLSSVDLQGNWDSERLRRQGLSIEHQWSKLAFSGISPSSSNQCQTTSTCSLSKMLWVFIQPLSVLPKVDSTQWWAKANQTLIHTVRSDMPTQHRLWCLQSLAAAGSKLTGARHLAKQGSNLWG